MINFDYFRAVQGTTGLHTETDIRIAEAKQYVDADMQDSIGYTRNTKRNGVDQSFIIQLSDSYYKSVIIARPNEDLFEGDMVERGDEHWLVVNVRVTNPVQRTALAWLCNHKFRWQDHDGNLHEQWGVLDAGVYSTTTTRDYDASVTNKQYKVYIPYTDDTAKWYIDKRLAINKRYDARGNQILDVYKVTGFDPVSSSYGPNAHLLIAFLANDQYVAERDNLELLLCDYIDEVSPISTIEVTGRNRIRVGKSATYSTNVDGVSWTIDPTTDGVSVVTNEDGSATITVADSDDLIGCVFTLTASAAGTHGSIDVEVVSFG